MTVGSERSAETSPTSTEAPPPKKYGVTMPLSLAGPSEADLQRNAALEKVVFFVYQLNLLLTGLTKFKKVNFLKMKKIKLDGICFII